MSYFEAQQGTNPQGLSKPIRVAGTLFLSTTTLAGNASTDTGWMENNYNSLLFVIRADVAGTVKVEYSDNGSTVIQAGNAVDYSQLGMQIQRVLVPKGSYTKITYTNGSSAQSLFRLEVKGFTTLVQHTDTSLNVPVTGSELAQVVVAIPELDDGTGTYSQLRRTGTSLNVAVTSGITTGLTDAQLRATPVPVITSITSLTPTVTNVTGVTTTATLCASDSTRKGFNIFNSGSKVLYLKYGSGATTSSFSVRIAGESNYEMPDMFKGYTGVITGTWDASGGTARVTIMN